MSRTDDSDAPGVLAHMKWSLLLVAISVAVALIATPILRWLGFD